MGRGPGPRGGSFVPADETGDLAVGGDGSPGISPTTDRTSYAKSSVKRADGAMLLHLLLLLPHLHRHAVDFHVVLNGNYKAAASTDELGFYEIETVRVDLNIHIRCLHGKFSGSGDRRNEDRGVLPRRLPRRLYRSAPGAPAPRRSFPKDL